MYKIYINETPLILTTIEDAAGFGPASEKILILRYAGKKKFLLNIINQLENSDRFEMVVVFYSDLEALWETFCNCFKIIEAAGGAVFNEEGNILMIFRRGFWDLPKGKIDSGETNKNAAVREVQEETGLMDISLGEHLLDTYHTYSLKGKRILKRTFWYQMQTTQAALTPQTEEDIEEAVWVDFDEFLSVPNKVYGNILDVLNTTKSKKEHG